MKNARKVERDGEVGFVTINGDRYATVFLPLKTNRKKMDNSMNVANSITLFSVPTSVSTVPITIDNRFCRSVTRGRRITTNIISVENGLNTASSKLVLCSAEATSSSPISKSRRFWKNGKYNSRHRAVMVNSFSRCECWRV